MGIESASDRSITCLEGTTMRKLVAVAVAVGIDVAVVAENYMGVVEVAAGGNRSWNRLNFEKTRCRS